jgi:hypothetical protein
MSQAAVMRRSFKPVIASLENALSAKKMPIRQRKHLEYLLTRAHQTENKRQVLRRRHRRMVKKSRQANRG